MNYTYQTHNTCSREIRFSLEDGRIRNLSFAGGCKGNLQALSLLVEGKPAEDIIKLLRGNQCGERGTSCADQLAVALTQALSRPM